MRIVLPIGRNKLIANDVPGSMGPVSENENRSKIAVTAETKEEADNLFKGLSEGGAVEMPEQTALGELALQCCGTNTA